jgi:hypothetical protein
MVTGGTLGHASSAPSPAAASIAAGDAMTIENPVINSPFVEPTLHFPVVDGRVVGKPAHGRRPSEFFVPVAKPKKASPQLALQFGGSVRQQPNEIVNEIRQAVGRWRLQAYPHTTSVTKELLAHWRAEDRERRLFFCQIEAVETAIYLTEAAEKSADTKALNVIRGENASLNDNLPRMAFKMATGSGKTVVMAMLIAWQALNKLANPYDRRFSNGRWPCGRGGNLRGRRIRLDQAQALFRARIQPGLHGQPLRRTTMKRSPEFRVGRQSPPKPNAQPTPRSQRQSDAARDGLGRAIASASLAVIRQAIVENRAPNPRTSSQAASFNDALAEFVRPFGDEHFQERAVRKAPTQGQRGS